MSDEKITQFPAATVPLDPWDMARDEAEVKRVTEALLKEFPATAIKLNKHSRLVYVEYQQVIRRLITATGNHFSTEVLSVTEREWTKAKKSGMDQVLIEAVVTLTIPALGSSRTASGYQVATVGAGEDLRKGAVSDAIKKAAQQFGVAIDLAGSDGEDMDAADFDTGPAPQNLRQQNQQRPAQQGRQSQQPAQGQGQRPPARLSEKRAQQEQPQQPKTLSPRDQALHEVADYCGDIGITKDGMAAMVMAEYGKAAKDLTEKEAQELNQMVRRPAPDELVEHVKECLQHAG